MTNSSPLRTGSGSTGIAPGAVRTPINRDAWSTPEALDALLRLIPYKRALMATGAASAGLFVGVDATEVSNHPFVRSSRALAALGSFRQRGGDEIPSDEGFGG